MKNILLFAAAAMVAVGCSSADTKNDAATASLEKEAAKYQIIDQEFDNVLAPESDDDKVVP